MDFRDYQRAAARTSGDSNLAIIGLGVAGEAGEIADALKKVLGHGHEMNTDKLLEEAGDLLRYIAALCTALGADLGAVAAENIAKLERRYPDGFSAERSRNRYRSSAVPMVREEEL